MPKNKPLVLLLLVTILALLAANLAVAGDPGLEIEYPNLPSVQTPNTVRTILPVYVTYIINLAIIFSGLIIFGSLLYAGFLYMTSSGNPAALNNSKDRMLSSFLGIIVLLSSYLIFQTINPELIELKIGGLTYIGGVIFRDPDAAEGSREFVTTGNVADFGKLGMQPETLSFISTDVEVVPCKDPNDFSADNCENHPYTTITSDGAFPADAKAAKLIWKTPGVYLYDDANYKGEMMIYTGNGGTLGDFADKASSVFLKNPQVGHNVVHRTIFGVVLHKNEGFAGDCKFVLGSTSFLGNFADTTSSITVFKYVEDLTPGAGGVTLYTGENFGGQSYPVGIHSAWQDLDPSVEDQIYSLKIEGDYLVALAESDATNADNGDTGRCEIFVGASDSDSDLSDNPIGQCHTSSSCPAGCPNIFGWCPTCAISCSSSFIVIPIESGSGPATLPPPPPPTTRCPAGQECISPQSCRDRGSTPGNICNPMSGFKCCPTPPPGCIADDLCKTPSGSCCNVTNRIDISCPTTQIMCGPPTAGCIADGQCKTSLRSCCNAVTHTDKINCASPYIKCGSAPPPGCDIEGTIKLCSVINCCPGLTKAPGTYGNCRCTL